MQSPSTLREKLGQLLLVGFRGSSPADTATAVRDIREHHIGGVLLFDQEMADGSQRRRNIESPEQLRTLVTHLRAHADTPLLVAIDQEGGRVNRLKQEYGFPATVSHEELGQSGEEATLRQSRLIAQTLSAVGINFNLAPVVDLDANPDNPIIKGKGRCFSSDPASVAAHAKAFVRAHREAKVLSCAKHFPGHGSASGDTHLGLVDVTTTWNERELIPFQELIQSGLCDAVMSAHVFNRKLDPDYPSTLSRAVITGLLREKLGFRGVIVSDDIEMKAISSHYGLENAVPLAINAGVDLLCFGNNLKFDVDIAPKVIDILFRAVESGRISASRIDESVARILALKRTLRDQ